MSDNEQEAIEPNADINGAKEGESSGAPQFQSVRSYLEEHNLPFILQQGLLEVERKRPEDPVTFLGEYLISQAGKPKSAKPKSKAPSKGGKGGKTGKTAKKPENDEEFGSEG